MSTLVTTNLKNPSNPGNNLVLDANGSVTFSGGSATIPAINFSGDTDTGIYSPGANQVAIATGGVQRLLIGSDGSITPASPLRFPLGNAAAPSVSFTGDTDTGIYSPSANSVAISTGGTGRLFVDASGVITNSSSSYLAGSGENVFFSVSNYRGLTLNTETSTHRPTLSFRNSSGAGALAYIQGDGQALAFGRAGQDYGGHQESMRITSAGLVGIGNTTGLGGTLGVSGHISLSGAATGARYLALLDETNTYAGSYVLQAGGGSAGFGGAITMYGHSHATYPGSVYIGTSASSGGKVYIGMNNALDPASARMTVTTTGVGIGTSSVNDLLHLRNGSSFAIRLDDTSNTHFIAAITSPNNFGNGTTAGQLYLRGAAGIGFSGNGGTSIGMVVDSSNRVGIGTTSPVRALDVNGSIQLPSNNALFINGSANYLYADSSATEIASATLIKFVANSAERLRITSAGLVGVGTSSPVTKLDVRSGVITAGSSSSPSGTEILRGYYSETDGALAVIGTEQSSGGIVIGYAVKPSTSSAGAFLSSTTVNVGRGAYTITGNSHKWYIGGAQTVAENSSVSTSEVMRIDSSGSFGIGTSSPNGRLDVADGDAYITKNSGGDASGVTSQSLYIRTQSGNLARLYSVSQGSGGPGGFGGDFRIQTKADNGALADRFTINYLGSVGIGTTSPAGKTEIVSSGSESTLILRNSSIASSTYSELKFAPFTGTTAAAAAIRAEYYQDDNSSLAFRTTNTNAEPTTKMFIDQVGRVGIGTTSPRQALTFGSLTSSSTSTPDCIDLGATLTSTSASTNLKFKLYVDSSGNTYGFTVNGSSQLEYCAGTVSSPGNHVFLTGGSERARIDSSGRLLVGTSSARTMGTIGAPALFEVESSTNASLSATRTANDSFASTLVLAKVRGTAVVSNNDEIGLLSFEGHDGTSHVRAAGIAAQVDGTPGANDMPGRLVFFTTADGASSPTERLRIDSRGYLTALGVYNNTTAAAANVHVSSAGGELFRSTSSIKYKTDVETIQDSYSEALLNCRPVWYRSTCEGDNANWGWWGFIAEEVAEIDPRLVHWKTTEVTYDEKGTAIQTPCDPEPESVQYDRFVPHLLNLVKRQQQAIETLEAKVAALESA